MNPPTENKAVYKFIIRTIVSLFLPVFSFAQNDQCSNATLLVSAPGCYSTAGTLTGATYTAATGLPGCSGSTATDVWYRFVAQSTNPTITVVATSGSSTARRFQLFSGTCGSLTSLSCSNNSNTLAASGLTLNQTYYIRVYSTGSAFNFNICVTDPNDACTAATSVLLTSQTGCTNVSGNVYGATNTNPTITAPNCATGATRDVWYRFVAQTTNPTISLSNLGSEFTNPGMQILSSSCGGTFTQFYCGTTSIAANFLTPGTTYMIRVYSTTASAPTNPANAGFDLCITDPVSVPPSNDECVNAVNLGIGAVCSNLAGDMAGATASSIPLGGSCSGPNAYDVWYKFTAVNSTATIALSGFGTNFQATRGIEILSGSCGSFTSVACGINSVSTSSLTAGTTYYLRVYSTTAPAPNGNARFNICATSSALPTVRFGNSYVNVSKKTTGGVVQPGDTLEIRMTIQHSAATTMTNLRFVDNLPTRTAMLTGTDDSIRVITNEGKTYKHYSLAAGDDAATYLAAPPAGQFNIRMNLGFGGTNPGTPTNNTSTEATSATGTMVNTNNPRGGGGLLFATSYRVVVTGNVGDTISLNPAQFIYRTGGSDVTLTATPYKILISEPLTLCANSIGLNSAGESGGTFGSGTTLNRTTDLVTPISGYSFLNNVNAYNGLGDGYYAIVKNISPRSSTNRTANRVPNCGTLAYDDPNNCNNRMHGGHWDIDGDHSGTNNAIGNTPPSETANSGYMLMVNADYVASEVYTQTLTNLCPNTYYEFSAWFRNICPTCGADSLGNAPATRYPGVYPNLSFALNSLDYYNTGEIDVTGWQKKGFVFRTGATQTSATLSIRNNAQGGGGNDWVMDDIAVATCLPNMSYTPTRTPVICESNDLVVNDTITSYFNSYNHYKWQRRPNGSATWTDIPGHSGDATPTYINGQWQYYTTYQIPASQTTLANNGDQYRVIVATSTANLSDASCQVTDGVSHITLTINNCSPVLGTNFISFTAKAENGDALLRWTTDKENEQIQFIIEKSSDGVKFTKVDELSSHKEFDNSLNTYSWSEPYTQGKFYYRVKMISALNGERYSKVAIIGNEMKMIESVSIPNPFTTELTATIQSTNASLATLQLVDNSGRIIKTQSVALQAGTNKAVMTNLKSLPTGFYTLKVVVDKSIITKKLLKQ